MDRGQEVLDAADRRAAALAGGDEAALRSLLHPDFAWTSYLGERFDLESYLRSNVGTGKRWHSQRLRDPRVAVVGDTAVLTCIVTDVVEADAGPTTYDMPMTQTWVYDSRGWRCLAGHTGPRFVDS